MMLLVGQKRKKLFTDFIEDYFPSDIKNYTYVEPFGGTYAVSTYLKEAPKRLIYNDVIWYDFEIVADEFLRKDFSEVLSQFNSEDTFFYLDPPYYGKEHLYGLPDFDKEFHIRLRDEVIKNKGKFVISYEDNKFIREVWQGFEIVKYSGDNPIFRKEILILFN